jgi:hypothetical protein
MTDISSTDITTLVAGDPVGVERVDGSFVPLRFSHIDERGFAVLTPVMRPHIERDNLGMHFRDSAGKRIPITQPVQAIWRDEWRKIRRAADCAFTQKCDVCDGTGIVQLAIPLSDETESAECGQCHGRKFIPWEPFADEPTI